MRVPQHHFSASRSNPISRNTRSSRSEIRPFRRSGMSLSPAHILEHGTTEQKRLLYLRHVIQTKHKIAKSDGATSISNYDLLELDVILRELSFHRWVDDDFNLTKVGKAVKLLRDENLFGDDIAAKASILVDRWSRGNFAPGPMEDLFEDDEFSSATEDESDSADESVVAGGARGGAARGLMRGIEVALSSTGRKTYLLDRNYPKRDADVFGANGHTVGDWWPYQICALRDGAHGSRMGGIHGRIGSGAYSIVISGGGYEETDSDHGDVIYYSGSRGEPIINQPSAPPITNATRSLIMSCSSQKPVRVLRSAKCASRWAPSVGIRYDGLYRVEQYRVEQDPSGKPYYRFTLGRIPGQANIDRQRPNNEERLAFVRTTGS